MRRDPVARYAVLPTLLMLAGLFVSSTALAADVKGSKDHPLIGRFAGSEILGYSHKNFNEYLFPEGAAFEGKDKKYHYKKSRTVEGEVTRILYVAPKETSVAEVFRNYQKQLQRKGFQSVFSCKGKAYECAYWMTGYMENFQPPLVKYAYKFSEHRYISMKKPDKKGDIYVSLLVYNYSFDYYDNRYNHPMVQLDVIQAEPLDDTQIVVLKADTMSDAIKTSGHVALHGIYFDTDSATLKPESNPSLEEIGKLLKSDATLKLHVVGHTDNTGTLERNMTLSEQRARAVMDALVSRYGAKPETLMAHGVGPLAPMAANTSEEGRAKNRRVDLVRQ